MARINLHTTPELEAALEALMKARGIRSKSEAMRLAVREAAAPYLGGREGDAMSIVGLIDWLTGERQTGKTSAELLAEIDEEMEAKLERLSRRSTPTS